MLLMAKRLLTILIPRFKGNNSFSLVIPNTESIHRKRKLSKKYNFFSMRINGSYFSSAILLKKNVTQKGLVSIKSQFCWPSTQFISLSYTLWVCFTK